MADSFRWGILGTGNIARKFATGLQVVPDATLVAVGSRAQETAEKFGDSFDVSRRYATYEDLVNDADVDAVYVSTPHPFHMPNALLCLEAGKPVLCEKPFALNRHEAQKMVDMARKNQIFLMEAMWTRFLPVNVQVRKWVADGAIGDVRMVMVDFGFRANLNPKGRLFDLEMGGGALLDVGIYTVSFAGMIYGKSPSRVTGMADIGETGVDEQAGMILGYDAGEMAILACGVRTKTPHRAVILGTEGSIEVPAFWQGTSATLSAGNEEKEVEFPYKFPYNGNGYNFEAEEVMGCVREGKTESGTISLDETLSIMETLDEIRTQWGLKYPME